MSNGDTPQAPQIDFSKYETAPAPKQIDFSQYAVNPEGATLKAQPKVGSAQWFRENADKLSDYLGAAGATVGGVLGSAAGPVGAIGGAALGGAAGEATRELVQRGLGSMHDVPQTSGEAAKQIGKEGLIQGAVAAGGEGLSAGARAVAPSLAESALNVGERLRGRGRTIGEAVLGETSGIGPKAVGRSAQASVKDLTSQLEVMTNQATQQGAMGSSLPAHQMLDDTINRMPRNAKGIIAKLGTLRDQLDLRPTGAIGPMPTDYTPNELLEMKRGIGKEVGTWPLEWQKSSDVKYALTRLYGAIDDELDRVAPGTGDINQKISSLIPAVQQGKRLSDQASMTQKLAHRMGVHTGALAGAGIGAVLGKERGGGPGAALGAAAGFIGPEMLASPQAQMLAARALSATGSTRIPLARLLGAFGADYLRKPNREEDENQQ